MSEFAGNLPRKFISFRHLGVESNAHELPEEPESENPQKVAESGEVNTVEIGEAPASPAKVMSVLQNVPVSSVDLESGKVQKDLGLTIAENDNVLKSSEEDMDDLNAFVNEKLQSLNLVYLIFNLLIYSLVIKIAILVNRAVLDETIVPAPGLMRPIVELPTAYPAPTSISVMINNIFFLFKLLYFSLYYSLLILRDFKIFFGSCFSV